MNKKDANDKMKKTKENLDDGNSKTYYKKIVENADEKWVAKSKSTIKRLTLGSLMLFLFMLLYIPSLLNWLTGSGITRDIIRNGVIEEFINVNGILARDEELLKAPAFGGRYVAEIGEGERTPAYSCIATVLNDTSDALLQELEQINARIAKARMEKAEKTVFFSEDLEKLDDEIGLQVQNVITACNARSFDDIGRYRSEIAKIVEKKAEIVGESSTDSYISSLKQQKESVQKELNKNTVQVVSNISGVVSYAIDGYETVLTPKSLSELTPEQLDHIREEYSQQQKNDGRVIAGLPLAKIIKGTDIYITAAINTLSASSFKVGDKIKLRINDIGLETSGFIENINKPDSGRTVVVVRTSRGADILSAAREVNVDFISKNEEGLKVPLSCLRDISADSTKAGIMLIKYNVAAYRIVDIICRDEEYAIIRTPEDEQKKTVNLYDTYIINPDNIKEGDIIEK